ncbi:MULTISPECIES: FAD-dependent monooxygenase [unclassified Rhodococcus (in: high G+C Gram-positive bacteria)]|uniref:FAD-dependent monooxygenase n=1 Tax=unclassified Rhodococcus (in: high G+C Gram-positive bacteria) TaxID=192944 RepID=UPI0006FC8A9C|nr:MULTISPECIES: FAD-dependent monooxygenase [unclassified Rhodococcus (in: high G+C Gram-positive bacteria)]KQU28548.1 hypothetical protein ASG69_11170 [Rhodococcus sp. Leaf225]KQU47536.1 hypothetical protein ASH03_21810 [Rhodococcus sp. Leaf258]
MDSSLEVPHVDVAVVGFGPGGEVLASLLGQRGHSVVVFEKAPEPYGLPRMSTLDGEIARLLQHTGDPAEALLDAIPQLEVEIYGADSQRVGTLDWSERHSGYPSRLSLHQPNIESAMERRIAECPSVEVRWGAMVTAVESAQDGGIEVTSFVDGTESRLHARYLVGMDGASSTVRSLLGIDVETLHEHDDRWVLTDYEVVKPLPDGLDHRIYMDMNLVEPYFYGPNGAGRCRTDVKLAPDVDIVAVQEPSQGFEFLEKRVGIPRDHVTQTRRVIYRFRSHMANAFRVGDAFIGGDAAHAMPPHMGQGACTAMRDAVNLGWKLDMVLSGTAAPDLLDTYESERLEHDSQFVHGSFGSWSMVVQPDRASAEQRDEFLRTSEDALGFYLDPLRDGVLHRTADGGYGREAGELAPQGVVSRGGETALLDQFTGFGFQLVSTQVLDDALGADRIRELDRLGVRRVVVAIGGSGESDSDATAFDDVEGAYGEYFRTHGATAFIGRPDFYTFGLADGDSATVALVDDLLAQLPAPVPTA